MRSYFNCFVRAGYFQSNLGVFFKAVLYIQRFMDLLKGRLTHSMNTRWGQLKMMVQKWGSHSPRGQKEKKKWLTNLFWSHESVSWQKSPAAQPPCVTRTSTSSLAHIARLSRRIKMSELKSTWEKNWTHQPEWKWGSQGMKWFIFVYTAKCWQMKGYPTFSFSHVLFLLEQWCSSIAVCENHLGRFFFKQLYWCVIDVQ